MSEEATKDAIRDSLNASLESLDALAKSDEPSDEQLEELLGDEDVQERIEEMLKAKKKKNNNNDDDDDEDEKEDKGTNYGKTTAKSDEDADGDEEVVEEDVPAEEVSKLVSGVPVLKAFERKLDKAVETLTVHSQVLKSLIESQVEQVNLVKSTSKAMDVFRSVPRPRKAVTTTTGVVLEKNFDDGGEGAQAPNIPVTAIKQAMQKAFNDGVVKMHDVSRCEMSNWTMESVPAAVQETLVKSASVKKED